MTEYKRCHDCDRKLRPVGTKAADHPGTVSNQGRQLCSTHWVARKAAGTLDEAEAVLKPMSSHCLGPCGRPLRSRGKPISEAPGTVAHKSNSMCATCYREVNGDVREYAEEDDRRLERMRREQVAFHESWRRRRGIPVDVPIDLRQIAMAA